MPLKFIDIDSESTKTTSSTCYSYVITNIVGVQYVNKPCPATKLNFAKCEELAVLLRLSSLLTYF